MGLFLAGGNIATPIMVERSLLGVIQLMNTQPEKVFSDTDQRRIKDLADILGKTLLRLQQTA